MWPSAVEPRAPPSNRTTRSRASVPLTGGHGWPDRQLPSISRAATPAMRIFGPSTHHIGPSPSQTAVGVQRNVRPAGMTGVEEGTSAGGRKFQPMTAMPNRMTNPLPVIRTQFRRHRGQDADRILDPHAAPARLPPLSLVYSWRTRDENVRTRLGAPATASKPNDGDNDSRRFCDCGGTLRR